MPTAQDKLASAITRDTYVNIGLVLFIGTSIGGGAWFMSGLVATVDNINTTLRITVENQRKIQDQILTSTNNRWTADMQATYEASIANDLLLLRQAVTKLDERVDSIDSWIARREGPNS